MIKADIATSLAAQMARMTLLLKTMASDNGGIIGPVAQMNVMNQVVAVICGHLYDMCLHNPQLVCYVQNNPYSKAYNPNWMNHPNFS